MDRRTFLGAAVAAVVTPAFAAGKRPRILLKSGWQTVNIGDIGHTPGMIRFLNDYLPDAEIVLWPNNIKDGVKEMLQKHYPRLQFAVTNDEVKKAFEDCDFCLHSSGPSLVAEKPIANWAEKTKKPYGVLGITLGSVTPESKKLLDNAKFLYLRDTISLDFAKKAGIQCPVIDFAPDSAFGVNITDDAKADAFLKKHDLEAGKYVCVIPKFRNTQYWLIRKKEMTEQDKAKHKRNEEMKESDFVKFRPAILEVLEKTQMKVVLVPEDVSHVWIHKEMIYDRLPEGLKSRVVWKQDYWLTDEAVSVYKKSAGLLSMDMHSPIMCIGNGIPAIHCRFAEQTTKGQMWNDIGLNDWLFNLDEEKDGTRLAKAALEMLANPALTSERVKNAQAFVKEKTGRAFQVLRQTLG